MNNRFILLIAPILLLESSCQREMDWCGAPEIKATVEAEQKTRTSLSVDESGAGTIYWNPADQIDVFFGTKKAQYISQNALDATSAVFKTNDTVSNSDISSTNIWGLYPSNSSSSCNGSSVTTTLPSTQYGVPNTFDDDLFLWVAHSSTTSLQFYNVCGGIKFSLAYDDIKKITLRGNNNENLAGKVSISFESGVPKATIVSGVKEITLTPKTGTTFTKGVDYYITLLPGTLSSGFKMAFTTTKGTTGTLNYTDSPVTIKRSVFSKKGNMDAYAYFGDERQPNNIIYYTSTDGKIVTPHKTDVFGASIVSNEYVGGKGIITFDGAVTSIDEDAFYNCKSLTSIDIPESVTSIGNRAFYVCRNLTSIDIPNSVTSIGVSAFRSCISLSSISIPSSVTSIGGGAFGDCRNLTSIVIPNSVTSIGESVFGSCFSLTSVIVDNGNPAYDSRNNCNAIIETLTNTLVAGCSKTVIPSSVTSIGEFAFDGCQRLTSIDIPESVTSIGENAFRFCFSLNSIGIPYSVTSIGEDAFYYCSSLTSIGIPYSVTSIGEDAFGACSSLTSVIVDIGNPAYDSRNNCNAIIETSTNTLVAGCSKTVIPDSVTSIGGHAFYRCSSLTSIDIPESVMSIGEYAFDDCSSLISIDIPESVMSIGEYAFAYCSSMTSITVKATTPPSLGYNVFGSTNNCPIYVPAGSVDAYKSAWSAYADRILSMGNFYKVDLGLSVKWATFNLGASKPEEYGDYYAWGETEPYYSSQDPLTWKDGKTGYYWDSYQWCNGSYNTLTRYCPSDKTSYWGGSGAPDGKTEFQDYNYVDDAARQILGGKWRTPTDAEWTELRENCTWVWTTQNGVKGYRVTSNKTGYTGKTIFLPAAGYRNDTLLYNVGSYGYYWSSSLNTGHPSYAWDVGFYSSNVRRYDSGRCYGFSVRPVSE